MLGWGLGGAAGASPVGAHPSFSQPGGRQKKLPHFLAVLCPSTLQPLNDITGLFVSGLKPPREEGRASCWARGCL